jgi:hypothetical protein
LSTLGIERCTELILFTQSYKNLILITSSKHGDPTILRGRSRVSRRASPTCLWDGASLFIVLSLLETVLKQIAIPDFLLHINQISASVFLALIYAK